MGQLQKIESQLEELGYQVIAASQDSPEKLRQSVTRHSLTYELVSDPQVRAARAFGIVFRVSATTLKQYQRLGMEGKDPNGAENLMLPVPAVFLIGRDGVIDFEYVNPDYTVRLDPGLLLAAARAGLKER